MQALLPQAIGVFDALWKRAVNDAPDTPEGRAALQKSLEQSIAAIRDPILQQTYRQSLRERLFQLGRQNFSNKSSGGKRPLPKGLLPKALPKGFEHQSWQVLLVAALNHPFLLVQQAEALGSSAPDDPDLDRLREGLVAIAHETPESAFLTPEQVKESLSKRGLNPILASLNQESVAQNFSFTRPDTPADAVLEGWKDVWTQMQRRTLAHDRDRLLQNVKTQYSDDVAERLLALSRQEQHLLDDSF